MYLPLGRSCRISLKLRDLNLRFCAFPFDWSLTPASAVNTLVSRDFFKWPSPEKLIACEPIKRILVQDQFDGLDSVNIEVNHGLLPSSALVLKGRLVRPVICEETGILFPHEPFFERQDECIKFFLSKYKRRVHRMQEAIALGGVIGIRDDCIEPNEFQISYLDRYLGNGASVKLYGPQAESIDSILLGKVLGSTIKFDDIAK